MSHPPERCSVGKSPSFAISLGRFVSFHILRAQEEELILAAWESHPFCWQSINTSSREEVSRNCHKHIYMQRLGQSWTAAMLTIFLVCLFWSILFLYLLSVGCCILPYFVVYFPSSHQ